jgi:hypothetical protein
MGAEQGAGEDLTGHLQWMDVRLFSSRHRSTLHRITSAVRFIFPFSLAAGRCAHP